MLKRSHSLVLVDVAQFNDFEIALYRPRVIGIYTTSKGSENSREAATELNCGRQPNGTHQKKTK